jgi:hypothetical protein
MAAYRIALLLCSLLAAACGSSFQATAPPGFVELEEQKPYDWRATTADGLVIAVRELDHDPPGEKGFWTRAIENQLRQRGGYALLGTRDVKNADGLEGTQLRFGYDEQSAPHLYYVTLFVTDKRLFLVEAGGTKELVERHADQIDWAIQNFRVK